MNEGTPTLQELLEKFREVLSDAKFVRHSEAFEQHFRMVASGSIKPRLTAENAVLGAQCVVVILEHVKREAKGGEA